MKVKVKDFEGVCLVEFTSIPYFRWELDKHVCFSYSINCSRMEIDLKEYISEFFISKLKNHQDICKEISTKISESKNRPEGKKDLYKFCECDALHA